MSVTTTMTKKAAQKTTLLERISKNKPWLLMNTAAAINDYNTSRAEGKGRIHSAVDAGTQFLTFELLGKAALPLTLASSIPSVAVSGMEKLDQLSRQMNLVQHNIPFGNTRFYDTKQGYTMRQQGMALAKNSRYQLEQTLMGNEAQYLKR